MECNKLAGRSIVSERFLKHFKKKESRLLARKRNLRTDVNGVRYDENINYNCQLPTNFTCGNLPQSTIDYSEPRKTYCTENVGNNVLSSDDLPQWTEAVSTKKQPFASFKNRSKTKHKLPIQAYPVGFQKKSFLRHYYDERYKLFHKFDEGIKLDEESWYSVTPENVAKHIADRCRCDVIIDAFCGAGGNTIQFAMNCNKVIAIDIDEEKIKLAKNNAKVYNVADRIEFIVGDFFELAPSLKADVVFLSPPWGGPDYKRVEKFALSDIEPYGGEKAYKVARQISDHVAMFLPRNINVDDILNLLNPQETVEIEQEISYNKLVAVTAFFGELSFEPEELPTDVDSSSYRRNY